MFALKTMIFYCSHLIWPYILLGIFFWYKGKQLPSIYYSILLLGLVLSYARFVEPRILIVKTTEIKIKKSAGDKDLTVVVFADTHFGIYKNAMPAERIVKKVNEINPDLILIPGDFLYEIENKDIRKRVEYFKNLKAPVFAVTGNHDEMEPGYNYEDELVKALKEVNIRVLNNSSEDFSDKIHISGLSDLWAGNYDQSTLDKLNPEKFNILLSHNPDMVYKLPTNKDIDLVISGHTHGGQIRLPILYKRAIPTEYNFDKGYYENQNGYQVFVTSGTGMVGLPMRFLMPPRIDILKIKQEK